MTTAFIQVQVDLFTLTNISCKNPTKNSQFQTLSSRKTKFPLIKKVSICFNRLQTMIDDKLAYPNKTTITTHQYRQYQ